jgi:phosphoserine aminotransferase
MARKIFFTVGPSAIYSNLDKWTNEFYAKGHASEYHRSSTFQYMYQHLDEQLRILMNIPSTHAIFLASSGSEIMERILQNCVSKSSFHFINGAFSKKFYNYAKRIGLDTSKYESDFFIDFYPFIHSDTELICITHNETSTGIKTNEWYIHNVKKRNPKAILAVDTVSSAPFVDLDYSLVDISFFSSQKAFGLPAGLGVWIINKTLADALNSANYSHNRSAHNTIGDLLKNYKTFQTPSTPNVLGIYLMGRVAQDMNQRGLGELKEEMLDKKNFLQSLFTINDWLGLSHNHTNSSDTVLCTYPLNPIDEIRSLLLKRNIICSDGYAENKDKQLRFSNFPANSWKDIEYLAQVLKQ